MIKKKKHAIILASGGIDSTACINFYKNLNFDIFLIFFDYGQPSAKLEHKAISRIAHYYSIPFEKITIKNLRQFSDGLILGRNAAFYFLALMHFDQSDGVISSGIHYGTGYYDCSQNFIDQVNKLIYEYSQDTIRAEAPFIDFTKKDILEYCFLQNVPLELTYSCELGKKQPCGICATCKDLIAIYALKKY